MASRMWVVETDKHGNPTDNKFAVDDPVCIPRVGEHVDYYGNVQSVYATVQSVYGKVSSVHYNYRDPGASFKTIIIVYLECRLDN